MSFKKISINTLVIAIGMAAVASTATLLAVLWAVTHSATAVLCGLALALLLFFWVAVFVIVVRKKIEDFTSAICLTLDDMMSGSVGVEYSGEEETLFVKINHRLRRLYDVMLEGRNRAGQERARLQELISDISHQVKTPISNLKITNDLLLSQDLPKEKEREFLTATSGQLDKLDFLMQAMVKTSRLEAGVITMAKTETSLYETLATALGGILLSAEKKQIQVTVDCPKELLVPHDKKWTGEALFNILDNAVKYMPAGGRIDVRGEKWEFYTKIDVTDTGKGIPESHQANIFKRFYREEEVHAIEGIGIGLYLAREIVTMQGGYIKLTSQVGKGSTFSVFLPNKG